MNFKNYLYDNRTLLIFFTIGLAITSCIILLDPKVDIHLSNLIYLLVILSVLFSVFILLDYRRKKEFYCELTEKTESGLPLHSSSSLKFEERNYLQLLMLQSEKFEQEIECLKKEQKEWNEYMTTWVHEIKTPIAVSKMIYETEPGHESLEEEMEKIEKFVDQALYYVRSSDFNKDYFIQEWNIEQIIKESIKVNRKLFLTKNIKLQLALSPLSVLTDKKGLQFIVNQILSNSLKYTSKGGEISLQIDQGEKRIIIRDNGIGIANEDLPRVFEKSFTGKNGRQVAASTGMGLYLAKKISEKLGHKLIIESNEGNWTEVSIYFSKNVEHLRGEFDFSDF